MTVEFEDSTAALGARLMMLKLFPTFPIGALALFLHPSASHASTCRALLKETSHQSRLMELLQEPQQDLLSYEIQPGELIHGTSAQALTIAVENGALTGRIASEFSAAMKNYNRQELAADARHVYAYLASPPAGENPLDFKRDLQSAVYYAEAAAQSHSFADLLNVDWTKLDITLTSELGLIRSGDAYFDELIDFYTNEYKNPERASKLRSILNGRTYSDVDGLIESSTAYRGVLIILKKTVSEQHTVVIDPETESGTGAIISSPSGIPLDQIDRIYPLSWNDYYLLREALK